MTSLASRLARPEILALAPFDIAANANEAFGSDAIKLDANENPYPPLAEGTLATDLNRYPEPQPARLKRAMAALYGVQPESLAVTRGSGDAIDVLVRAFCRPGMDAVSILTPTFAAYAHFARLQGARVIEARLDESFDFNAGSFLETVRTERSLKLAFICSPNNPTGNPVDPADVLRVAEALPETIVVLDEAYLEFSETSSLASEAISRPNLVVLKTLSKAFGLAGARVGGFIGSPELVAIASRALPPYPLPSLSIEAAMFALAPSRRPIHEERIARIKADRERLAELFAASPIVNSVRSGGGNFLFLQVEDPAGLARKLNALGIRARFRPNAAPGGLRLTVGTDAENQAALAAFGVPPVGAPSRRAEVIRDTKETKIAAAVDLDRAAPRRINTGIPFYDHMLDQVAAHGGFSLILSCEGDLDIDAHHSLEDCAIAFGTALSRALADRRGIGRFGFSLPMDETEAHVLIDLSGRPYSVFEGSFQASHIGAYPTEMTRHIFRSLADSLGAAIHVRVVGDNDHHKTEACFKAFGRALRQAVGREGDPDALPSTKGGVVTLAIVDVGCGNIGSVGIAFERFGIAPLVTGDAAAIASSDKVILPGVGAAGYAMEQIRARGLADTIRNLAQPVLGICLGMQLLFEHSEEEDIACLGIIPGHVRKLEAAPGRPVPHMGWSRLQVRGEAIGLKDDDYVYFAHSYACDSGPHTAASTEYGREIPAVVRRENFVGAQFHPERSGEAGHRFLKAFLDQ